jgi:hypothetical protein
VAKRKGFFDDPDLRFERLTFAQWAITWMPERLRDQIISDEVWAYGGAYTQSYISVRNDGSDRYADGNVDHKYRKLPAWIFHGTIVDGKKGLYRFWEKE